MELAINDSLFIWSGYLLAMSPICGVLTRDWMMAAVYIDHIPSKELPTTLITVLSLASTALRLAKVQELKCTGHRSDSLLAGSAPLGRLLRYSTREGKDSCQGTAALPQRGIC